MGQASHEPSMEDILASIKRIIAEDSEAVGARPARLRREAISAVQSSPTILRAAELPVAPAMPEPVDAEVEQNGLPEDQPDAESVAQDWAPEDHAADARAEDDSETGEAEETAAAPTDEPEQAPEDVLELTSPMPEANSDMPETRDAPAARPATGFGAGTGARIESLVSGQAATASRNAFAALTQLQVRNEDGQSNTLEGLVADLLRPMLREWLDRELPPLVERVVTAEVRRLSGGNS
jgi:uncharacterized protein